MASGDRHLLACVHSRREARILAETSQPAHSADHMGPASTSGKPGQTPSFAHPSEVEFSKILDFYGLRWEYEPRSFPLRWEGEQMREMFTPDFYLPDLDLFVELTTMKQSLVTEKNRKIRLMHELYPEVSVRLLYRKDFHSLLAKIGFGPLFESGVDGIDRVLLTARQSSLRVQGSGQRMCRD